jgi:hypothetical protein
MTLTNSYVNKKQKIDMEELPQAPTYKQDWEQRHKSSFVF